MPPNTIYVGRPGVFGNPFYVGHHFATAKECVEAYRAYLPGLQKAQPANLFERLRGKDLACWCALDHPCHADVLLEIVNS